MQKVPTKRKLSGQEMIVHTKCGNRLYPAFIVIGSTKHTIPLLWCNACKKTTPKEIKGTIVKKELI